ncbi:MAG: prolipoprotein diacylglyceryl transferase [Clostridia bacterium]|nr:prolipoprotein diacylglyceryl transferase [Clostridia bacterium]
MDPIAFTIFGISVRWYGILISIGMILATIAIMKRARLYHIDPNRAIDFALVVIPFGVIGARLYYVIFNWSYYEGDFLKIINTRTGGLAIHGGLIAGILVAILLCKLWNIRVMDLLDLGMPAVALAQAVGRWGNFLNQEAYGTPTDLPWAILVDGQRVHPTFLYESVWNLLIFLFLIWYERRRKFKGQIFLLYAMLYSFARFFIEEFRTDSLMIGEFRVAQVLSLIVFIVCLLILRMNTRRKNRRIFR